MKQPDWGMGTVVDEKKKANLIGQLETRHVTASKSQYTRGSLLLKQTRATDLPLEFAPSYQTSLIKGSKTREQNFCCATYFFARNRWCRRGSFAPGASSLVCTGLKKQLRQRRKTIISFNCAARSARILASIFAVLCITTT